MQRVTLRCKILVQPDSAGNVQDSALSSEHVMCLSLSEIVLCCPVEQVFVIDRGFVSFVECVVPRFSQQYWVDPERCCARICIVWS